MDLIIGPIIEIFKCACPPLCKYVQYHRKLNEKMNDLERELQGLNKKKQDIEAKLSRAERDQGKKASNEVNDWLENVQRINSEKEIIQQEVKKRKYFSRARLGKLVEEKILEVKEYHQNGRSFTAENLVSDDPPTSRRMLPTTKTLAGEKTEKIVQEIWEDLMGDKVLKIGVWGMGGVGKTTVMSHVNNRLQEMTNKFDDVIWVTVSHPLDPIKLQTGIATALKESLPENEDKVSRAGRLLEMLKSKKKFVLILDDMWEALSLEEVGIPEPSKENACKLVITTRSLEVCRFMECKEVKVERLSEREALNFFLDKVGIKSILQVPTLEELITAVVKECAGLPLAIVTVAASMRGVYGIHEWRNALNELHRRVRSMKGVDTAVFGRLEFSYHRLKDEKVQQCFLYCALYPEDYAISKDELISYWIAEGFIEEVKEVQAKYDRGHTILDKLVNCCLLESAEDGSRVKMHDLIRDMALRITSDESPLFMVQAGVQNKFPGEQEWKANLERVSLEWNLIQEIPSNISPFCPTLSTLLLKVNRIRRIPECFFVHMHGLKVLNLSYTPIEVLPNSVTDLRNLRSLLLGHCGKLERVPSLANLLALQYLDLENTSIKEVPEGMEMLEHLVHLYLYSRLLQQVPTGILPKQSNLYRLKLYLGSKTLRETVEEAARLSNRLDTFDAYFSKPDDFNIYVKTSDGRGSKNFHFNLVRSGDNIDQRILLMIYRKVLNNAQKVVNQAAKSVCIAGYMICRREEPIVLPKGVECLVMVGIRDVTSLNDVLSREQGLVNISESSQDLKVLWFYYCDQLKKVFSPQLLPALQNLEFLEVGSCSGIKEIVAVNDEESENKEGTNTVIVTLPRLKKLRVDYLPALKSICSDNVVLVCNSLQEIEVSSCPKLKRLSLRLPLFDNGQPSPLPALEVIKIKKELWESLEWDQANARDVLNPYCKFVQS